MWGWTFLILFAVMLWQAWKSSPKKGLGVAIFLALLVPTWAFLGYQSHTGGSPFDAGERIDTRSAIGFVGLLFLLFRPKQLMPWRLHWLDLILLAIVSLHVASDSYHDGFSLGIVLRAFGEWCLPYLVGRTIICNMDDVRQLLTVAVPVCLTLSAIGVIECLAEINIAETVFGERPVDGAHRTMNRWGFKRAFGPAMHPIYFGMLQLLLMPWTLYAASRSARGQGGKWKLGTPAFGLIGILATVSRSPMLGFAVLVYVCTMLAKPRWRVPLVTIGLIIVVFTVFQRERVIRTFQDWTADTRLMSIKIDDQEVDMTSINSRIHVWNLYSWPLQHAGWVGYGTGRTDEFPVNVPLGPHEKETFDKFDPIDNAYLLLTLRFGYGGPILLLTFGLFTAYTFGYMAVTQNQGAMFHASMAAATIATTLVMWTIWMPQDFGFVFVMYGGIAAGLQSRGVHSNQKHSRSRYKSGFSAGSDLAWVDD